MLQLLPGKSPPNDTFKRGIGILVHFYVGEFYLVQRSEHVCGCFHVFVHVFMLKIFNKYNYKFDMSIMNSCQVAFSIINNCYDSFMSI